MRCVLVFESPTRASTNSIASTTSTPATKPLRVQALRMQRDVQTTLQVVDSHGQKWSALYRAAPGEAVLDLVVLLAPQVRSATDARLMHLR